VAAFRVLYVVTGAPTGELRYVALVDDERLAEVSPADAADHGAEVTLTATYDDARAIERGELDLNVGYMQGRVKVAGDMGKLLTFLPLTAGPEWREAQPRIAAATER
jgi:putative sterol carrier protein